MNKIWKTVWSTVRKQYVVVNEHTQSLVHGSSASISTGCAKAACMALLLVGSASNAALIDDYFGVNFASGGEVRVEMDSLGSDYAVIFYRGTIADLYNIQNNTHVIWDKPIQVEGSQIVQSTTGQAVIQNGSRLDMVDIAFWGGLGTGALASYTVYGELGIHENKGTKLRHFGDVYIIKDGGRLEMPTYYNDETKAIKNSNGMAGWNTFVNFQLHPGSTTVFKDGQLTMGGMLFNTAGGVTLELDKIKAIEERMTEKGLAYAMSAMVDLNTGAKVKVKTIDLTHTDKIKPNRPIIQMLPGASIETSLDQVFVVGKIGVEGSVDGIPQNPSTPNPDRIPIPGLQGGQTVTVTGFRDGIDSVIGWTKVQSDGTAHPVKSQLIFNDAKVTDTTVSKASDLVTEKTQGSTEVHFTGEVVSGATGGSIVFTEEVTNDLLTKNPQLKVVLDRSTFEKGNSTTGVLEVANSKTASGNAWIKDSIGFQKANGINKLSVRDGKEFTLVGSDGGYDTLIQNAEVSGQGSMFSIGSIALANAKGSIATATAKNGGTISARAGDYKIGSLTAASTGKVRIDAGNKTTVTTELKVEDSGSQIQNSGELIAQSLTITNNNGFLNKGTYQTVGNTTITGGTPGIATNQFAFHNQQKANATFSGKTTLGSVRSLDALAMTPLSVNERSTFMNEGNAQFADLELLRGSELRNWTGGNLTINSLEMDPFASITNTGTITFLDSVALKGTIRNKGTMNGLISVVEEGTNTLNQGTVNMQQMTLEKGAGYTTTDDTVVGSLSLAEGSTFTVSGDQSRATAAFNSSVDGTIVVEKGSLTVGYRAYENMKFFEAPLEDNSESLFGDLKSDAPDGAHPEVKTESEVKTDNVAKEDKQEDYDFDKFLTKADYPVMMLPTFDDEADHPFSPRSSLVLEQGSLVLGENGKVIVGANATSNQSGLSTGDALFEADSKIVLDTTWGGSLTGNGKGKLTATDGSKLVVKGSGWGTYKLAEGFVDADIDAWLGNIEAETDGRKVTINKNGSYLSVTIGSNDLRDRYDSLALINIGNAVIGNTELHNNLNTGLAGMISRGTDDSFIPASLQTQALNAMANVQSVGGLPYQQFAMNERLMNSLDAHLTLNHPNHQRSGLWIDLLGGKIDISGLGYTRGKASFDGDSQGVIVGADFSTKNSLRYGVAVAAQNGKVDSDAIVTKTETDAYSMSGYVAKDFGSVNLSGNLTYTHFNNEVKQNNPLGAVNFKLNSDMISAGVDAKLQLWTNGTWSVSPYVGLRSVTVLENEFTFKEAKFENESIQQFQLPVGVRVSAVKNLGNGWYTLGSANLGATFVEGDKALETEITAFGATDKVSGVFADDMTARAKLGLGVGTKSIYVGLNVDYAQGDSTDGNLNVGLKANYLF